MIQPVYQLLDHVDSNVERTMLMRGYILRDLLQNLRVHDMRLLSEQPDRLLCGIIQLNEGSSTSIQGGRRKNWIRRSLQTHPCDLLQDVHRSLDGLPLAGTRL